MDITSMEEVFIKMGNLSQMVGDKFYMMDIL